MKGRSGAKFYQPVNGSPQIVRIPEGASSTDSSKLWTSGLLSHATETSVFLMPLLDSGTFHCFRKQIV